MEEQEDIINITKHSIKFITDIIKLMETIII
jgi:hypothetical protein